MIGKLNILLRILDIYLIILGFGDILQQKYENLDRKEDLHESHLHHHDIIPQYKFLDKIDARFSEWVSFNIFNDFTSNGIGRFLGKMNRVFRVSSYKSRYKKIIPKKS